MRKIKIGLSLLIGLLGVEAGYTYQDSFYTFLGLFLFALLFNSATREANKKETL